MPEASVTREAAARFIVKGAKVLELTPTSDQTCAYKDLSSADQSLVEFINDGCAMGIFKAQAMFNPKSNLTRGQSEVILARAVYGMAEVSAYAADNSISETAAARELLMADEIVKVQIPADSAVKRLHLILMLYRLSEMDVVTTPTNTGAVSTGVFAPVAKKGALDVSLNAASPVNGSSIPYNGVVSFGKVDFKAGSSDITVNTVKMKREGL